MFVWAVYIFVFTWFSHEHDYVTLDDFYHLGAVPGGCTTAEISRHFFSVPTAHHTQIPSSRFCFTYLMHVCLSDFFLRILSLSLSGASSATTYPPAKSLPTSTTNSAREPAESSVSAAPSQANIEASPVCFSSFYFLLVCA